VPSLLSSSCDSHLLPHISLSNYPINQRAIIPPLNQFRWISHRFHLRIIPHEHMRAAGLPDRRLQFLYYTSPRLGLCLHFKYHRGIWLFSFCKAFRFRDTILALTSPTRCTVHFFLHMMSAFFSLPFTLRAIKKMSLSSLARPLLLALESLAPFLHLRQPQKTTKHTWRCHGSNELFSIHFYL
jgi:hypothetical protein